MAVLETKRKKTKPPAVAIPENQSLVLSNVDWQSYVAIRKSLRNGNIHITFDRGWLEIMTTSIEHERYQDLVRILIFCLAYELNVDVCATGSATQRKKKLERGLEPDLSFYLTNIGRIKNRKQLRESDPAPDLVVEIEVSRKVLDRLPIYLELGVKEIWRFDGSSFTVLLLEKQEYQVSDRSQAFPNIEMTRLAKIIEIGWNEGEIPMVNACQKWVREQLIKNN